MGVGIIIDFPFNYKKTKSNTVIVFFKCFKNIAIIQMKGIKEK